MRASLIALGLAACGTVTAAAPLRPHTTTIPLRSQAGGQLAITGSIGDQRGIFLFDSGWGISAVTPEMAKRIGCKPWGQLTGFRAIGERVDEKQCQPVTLTIGDRHYNLPTVMLIDIARFMPPDSPDYAGAIGLDAFAGKAITISTHARKIIIENPRSLAARVRRAAPVPIRLSRESSGAALTAFIGIKTERGLLWMLLDTGNSGGTMIGRHAASLLGLDPDPAKAHGQNLTMTVAKDVEFQGQVQVLNLIMDGNLGADFLDRWDLTIDLAKGGGWLTPAQDYDKTSSRAFRNDKR